MVCLCQNATLWIEIDTVMWDFQVPVIAVFTKYDQFKRDIKMRLEDEGCDQEMDLNTEVENIFNQHYLASLNGHPSFICLESEDHDFVNWWMVHAVLISVLQTCKSMDSNVLVSLKWLPMHLVVAWLPSCFWLYRGITWSSMWSRPLDGKFLCIAGQGQDECSHILGPIISLIKEIGVQKQ